MYNKRPHKYFCCLTVFIFCVDEFIETVKIRLSLAVNIVPPVAHKVLLIKRRPIWAEKTISISVWLAHMEDLGNYNF